jgi:hypothetical protein
MTTVRYCFFAALMVVCLSAFSQSSLPEPGKLTPDEIQLKECAFDSEANAVIQDPE